MSRLQRWGGTTVLELVGRSPVSNLEYVGDLGIQLTCALASRGGADAIGRSATAAVVKSTFLVILGDLGFTALFYLAGWN